MVLTELQFIINIYQFFTLHLALCHRDLTSTIYCRERNNRSSRPKLFCKKMFFKIPQNLEENTSSRACLLIDCRFIKIKKEKNFFPVNLEKFLRTSFFIEHLRGCFLKPEIYKFRELLYVIPMS